MLRAIHFYAFYLAGQTIGMGDALNVLAVRFGCECEQLPVTRWAEVLEESVLIHRILMEHWRSEAKAHGR